MSPDAGSAPARCAQCGMPMGRSPSLYFCRPVCQEDWHRSRTADPDQVLGVRGARAVDAQPLLSALTSLTQAMRGFHGGFRIWDDAKRGKP